MTGIENLRRAREATQRRVMEQKYVLNWRSGGEQQVVGITELPSILTLRLQSIRSYLSTGRGTFTLERANPLTGEPDVLTVSAVPPPAKPKPRRGRPPKQWHNETERLGTAL